jgi:acetylornithine deacetylase/succinyl-diaminopimelate desuccinylase-like protein
VTSFEAGSSAGAIPATAKATLDIRLPPNKTASDALHTIASTILGNRQAGVDVRLTCVAAANGVMLSQSSLVREKLDAACRLAFGRPVATVASGGSIPAVELLLRAFGRPPLLLGFGPADDGAHGPDERIHLGDWVKSVETAVLFAGFLSRSLTVSPIEHRGSGFRDTLVARGSGGTAAFF